MSLKNFHHVVISGLIVFSPTSILAADNTSSQQPSFLESLTGALAESLVILKEELSAEVAATDANNAAIAANAAAAAATEAAVAAVASEAAENARRSSLFKGFETCQNSRAATRVLEIIREKGVPHTRDDGAWSYPMNANVLGMKAHSISLGVCDIDGNADCGASGYLSFIIDMPLQSAKQHLIRTYGIDFTKEKRSSAYDGAGETERPVLTRDDLGNTILYCDAGGF